MLLNFITFNMDVFVKRLEKVYRQPKVWLMSTKEEYYAYDDYLLSVYNINSEQIGNR